MVRSHTRDEAPAAKEKAQKLLPNLASVAGIGITRLDGGYVVKVNLQKEPSPGITLPSDVDGVPVQFEVTGDNRKL